MFKKDFKYLNKNKMIIIQYRKWDKVIEYKDEYEQIDIWSDNGEWKQWLEKNAINIIENEYGHLIWFEIDWNKFDVTLNIINSQNGGDNDIGIKLTKKTFKEVMDKHKESFVWERDEIWYYYWQINIEEKNNFNNRIIIKID